MSRRRGILAAVSMPLMLSLVVAAVLLLRGRNHLLEITTLLPAAVTLSGLALSMLLLGLVGLMRWRTQWIEQGRLEATEQHRQRPASSSVVSTMSSRTHLLPFLRLLPSA